MKNMIKIADFTDYAQEVLPKEVFEYFSGGAGEEITLRENEKIYDQIKLNYRVLKGINEIDLNTTILGQKIDLPVIIAPMAFHKLAHPDGELGTVRATSLLSTIMIVSIFSTQTLESIKSISKIPPWFQLYIFQDRAITKELVMMAEACGYKALVLTVDTPVYGTREKEIRNNFDLAEGLILENLITAGFKLPKDFIGNKSKHFSSLLDNNITWADIEWLRSITKMPIILKGIMDKRDFLIAKELSIAAVIISNHGGRQLDTVPTSIEILQKNIDFIDKSIEIIIDGGIRKGSDIFKALALGAKAVLVGRPILWGLAVNGEAGVYNILNILKSDLEKTMKLCGCSRVDEINKEFLFY